MKNILIIKAHPKETSFCNALADKYIEGAKSKNKVKVLELRKLKLEKFLKSEHRVATKLSPDLLNAQKLIKWADHLVFAYPTWWATPPALLKLFFETILESGFAFKYHKLTGSIPKWDKLLSNKSARIIVTMDSPPWYYRWMLGNPGFKMMKANLNFCGIKPVHKNYFGTVKMSSEEKRKKWLEDAYKTGVKD